MGLLWPWSMVSPLNPLHAAEYFDTFFEKPWRELFAGQLIPVTDMPARYLPQLFALKLPEIMLALGACRRDRRAGGRDAARLAVAAPRDFLFVVLAAFFPVGARNAGAPGPLQRPAPFRVRGAALCGARRACRRLAVRASACERRARAALAAALACGIALPVSDMVRLHPYQYSAFNWVVRRRAHGARQLHARLLGACLQAGGRGAAREARRHASQAAGGRRWTIEICGPQPPAEVALGPDFETTWDRKRADFAMMLGTFYCRD